MKVSKHRFPYAIRDGVPTPKIKVLIGYKNKWINELVLLDSGADISLLTRKLGEKISIDIESVEHRWFRGIGNGIKVYLHNIEIKIGENIIEMEAAFADDRSWDINIIGRKDFFDKANITFLKNKEIIIEII